MSREFICKGKYLADYLIKKGHVLLRIERIDGLDAFVFEFDDLIDDSISEWQSNKRKWLF